MKNFDRSGTVRTAFRDMKRTRSGAKVTVIALWLCAVAGCAMLTGCLGFLDPAKPTARHYVLTPLTTPGSVPAGAASSPLAVGLGLVKVPAYLFNTAIVIRKGTNEIEYVPNAFWAERLDKGIQNVMAANLAALLPSDRIQTSAWQKEEVSAELYVTIEQFEVDASGHGVLVARWRVLSPGGDDTLKSGRSRLTSQGPVPEADVSGAVATLSRLIGDLSGELAQALKTTRYK
jgi:uncharacterized protein